MNLINNAKRTRFKMGMGVNIFSGALAIYAMHLGMENVATTCIAAILTVSTMFIGGDSFRKSES